MTPGVFMFLAALAVISALGTVVQRNPGALSARAGGDAVDDRGDFHRPRRGDGRLSAGDRICRRDHGAVPVRDLAAQPAGRIAQRPRLSRAQGDRGAALCGAGGRAVRAAGLCAQRGRRSGGRAHRLRVDRGARHDALFRLPDRVRGNLGAACWRRSSARSRWPGAHRPRRPPPRRSRPQVRGPVRSEGA